MARIFHIPAVFHIHVGSFADFYQRGGRVRQFSIRLASRLSDQVVFLSPKSRAELGHVFPLAKSRILPNPVDDREFAAVDDGNIRATTKILFLGWIVQAKGVYDLVDAMPEVIHHYPNAKFVFAGNKEVEKLKIVLAERALSNSSEVLGWVDGERRLSLLKTSTMLVLPSYTEGLPNVILEAMASHLPIITTPVGGIPDVVKDHVSALFITPGRPSEIAKAILNLLDNKPMREQISEAAYRHVLTDYSLAAVSKGLTNIYSRYL